MRSFQTERQFSLRKLLYKCAIFIAAVGVIVYFMPRTGTFNYQFDINKPWKYGLLQASFDFPIYKSDSEVKHEQDSIMKHYHPYFKLMVKKPLSRFAKITTGRYVPSSQIRDINFTSSAS